MILPIDKYLDLLACPSCRSNLRLENRTLVCTACSQKFESRSDIPVFLPPNLAERFATAQSAEGQHHEEAWTKLKFNYLPGVKTQEDYADWLESLYRMGLCAFGLATGYFRDKTVLEVGSGPHGMLACVPHARGLSLDPLMPAFASYMRDIWEEQPARVAGLGEQIPARSGMFDVALAINILDHTLEPEKIFGEFFRILKPGGSLLISNNVKSLPGKWISNFGEKFGISRLTEVFHPHAFTKKGLFESCGKAGFKVIGDMYFKSTEPEPLRKDWTWKHVVRRWIENERTLWILAKKPEQK